MLPKCHALWKNSVFYSQNKGVYRAEALQMRVQTLDSVCTVQINLNLFHLHKGPVIRATFFFNLSRNTVALQLETLVLPRLWPTCPQNSTRIVGQSCVIKDGSFFHIIERFDQLHLLAVIFFLIFRANEVLSVWCSVSLKVIFLRQFFQHFLLFVLFLFFVFFAACFEGANQVS